MLRFLKKQIVTAFMLIAEPRVIRIILFFIYGMLGLAGHLVIQYPSHAIVNQVGSALALWLGSFLAIGGILGLIAVLPGIWWLERAGVIASITGLLMYAVTVISIGTSSIGFPVAVCFSLFLTIRWIEIRRYQLAPRR